MLFLVFVFVSVYVFWFGFIQNWSYARVVWDGVFFVFGVVVGKFFPSFLQYLGSSNRLCFTNCYFSLLADLSILTHSSLEYLPS